MRRPLTKATAPDVVSESRERSATSDAGTTTASGVGAMSSSVPSMSRRRLSRRMSNSGFAILFPRHPSTRLDVTPELVAHRREELLAEAVGDARAEARIECGRQHRGGNGFLDGGIDGPAAFARVLDRALEL